MALTNVSQENFKSVTPSLPAGLERAADEQKFADVDPVMNLSGDLGEPVLEQQPASAHQRLDEDNATWELIHMDGEEVRFETETETDSEPDAPAAALGEIVPVLAQQPHSDSHQVQRPLPLDVGLTSDERPHSLSPGSTSRWVAKGERILQALYQSNDADLEITFNAEGYPQLPQCMSTEIKGLHTMFEHERQALAHSAARLPGACADLNGWVRSFGSTPEQQEQFDESRNDYLAAILCITWALYNHAEVSVKRGSYKIGDQNHKLYKFLVNFVQFANKTVSPSAIMPYGSSLLHIFPGNSYSRTAYSRTPPFGSSHYKSNPDQFGIDVRFDLAGIALPLFPNGGTHLLFGDVSMMGEKLTFLKIEETGLGTLGDFCDHSCSYAQSGVVAADSRREKDNHLMPEWLAFCQAAGMPHNPKEQIPVHEMYLRMHSRELHELHKLHKMHLDMGGHLQLTNPVQIARQAFLLKAIDLYGPDISLLLFRTGHEVFLDLRDGFNRSVELESSRASTMEGRTPHVGSTHGFFRQEGEAAVLETLMLIDEEKRQESSPKAIVLCELSRATVDQDAMIPASQSDSPSKGP